MIIPLLLLVAKKLNARLGGRYGHKVCGISGAGVGDEKSYCDFQGKSPQGRARVAAVGAAHGFRQRLRADVRDGRGRRRRRPRVGGNGREPRLDDRHRVGRGGRPRRGGHQRLRRGRRDIHRRAVDRLAQGRGTGHSVGGLFGLLCGGGGGRMSGRMRDASMRATVRRPAGTLGRVPVRPAFASERREAVVGGRLQRDRAHQGLAGVPRRPVRVLPGRAPEEVVGHTRV